MNFGQFKLSALAFASIASWNSFTVDPAAAAPVTFNFNGIGQNASASQISTYMTSVLGSSVTVYGATGEQGASSYTGDNHVTGPVIDIDSSWRTDNRVFPLTLANTDNGVKDAYYGTGAPYLTNGNTDGFIKNCTPIDGTTGCSAASPDMFIDFHGLKIVSFSFDYEIFPDGTCPKLNTIVGDNFCGLATSSNLNPNLPDLEVWTGGTTADHTGTLQTTYWGVDPAGAQSGASGSSAYSTETAPQLLGHGTITISGGYISTIDFMDWPETIGIDNLKIYLPEPSSFGLFAFGVLGLGMIARRKRLVNNSKQA